MIYGHPVDTPVINKLLGCVFNDNYVSSKDFADDIFNENHKNVEVEVQNKRSVELDQVDKNDDVPISNIMESIIESISKPQDKVVAKGLVCVDEETESDETYVVKMMKRIARSMNDR